MNIIQMKQEIKDIRAELAAEIDKGMEMAKNRATTLESIKAQSDKVDDLQIREALLMQALNTAEGKENPPQSKKLGQNGGFRSLGEFASAVHMPVRSTARWTTDWCAMMRPARMKRPARMAAILCRRTTRRVSST